jgi:prepilin-type N-terminal cleavage/methylation domain-containing protein
MKKILPIDNKGFTLVEILVSLSLLSVVVLICVGALLALVGADKKAQSIQAVMNDLNITIDSMARNMREGTGYDCGGISITVADCTDGNTVISFVPYGADPTIQNKRWVYQFVPASGSVGGYINRSKDGGATFVRLTSPDVTLTSVAFYVVGTNTTDNIQPRITIVLKGTGGAGSDARTSSVFHVEAGAVQRELDL